MRFLGYSLIAVAFPVAAYVVSSNNNLTHQPVIFQSQTWLAIAIFLTLVVIGWKMIQKRR